MWTVLVILLVAFAVLAVVGFALEGLFWLAIVGIVLFVVARIGGVDMWRLFRGILPFFVAELIVIVMLCLFPILASGLPGLLRN